MTNDEIIEKIMAKHFKRLEGYLVELNLPRLAYLAISKEFRFLEKDLKDGLAFQNEDLQEVFNR